MENKGAVLTFHYREVPFHLRKDLINKAEALMKKHGFLVGSGHCIVEAKPPVLWNKGKKIADSCFLHTGQII